MQLKGPEAAVSAMLSWVSRRCVQCFFHCISFSTLIDIYWNFLTSGFLKRGVPPVVTMGFNTKSCFIHGMTGVPWGSPISGAARPTWPIWRRSLMAQLWRLCRTWPCDAWNDLWVWKPRDPDPDGSDLGMGQESSKIFDFDPGWFEDI